MRKLLLAPAALLLEVVALAAVSGCQGTKAAYQEAQGLDEYAYVITEHYASLVKEAADLKAKPTTPRSAVVAMQRADAAAHVIVVGDPTASPAVPGLAQLVANYQQIRDAKTEAELQAAVNAAILKVADLVRAVKAARGAP